MYELIFHIADLHIRRGNEQNARYEEYRGVFERLIEALKTRGAGKRCAMVICGDVFHHKLEIAPAGIRLFYELIHSLAETMLVLIIQGNHDLMQEKVSEENNDLIEALLQSESHPNVRYLRNTGLYTFENLQFGVVSIRDILRSGAGSGMVEKLPSFPVPSESPELFRVALAHCTVKSCMLSTTQKSLEGVPVEWFSGYDVAMLGDVHMQHVVRNKRHSVVYGYPGSLVQQNFGEPLLHHGFIEWTIPHRMQEREVRYLCHHVRNTHGKLNAHVEGGATDWKVWVKAHENISLEELVELEELPQQLHMRLYMGKRDTPTAEVVVESIYRTIRSKAGRDIHVDVINTYSSQQEGPSEQVDISELNRIDTVCGFLERNMGEETRLANPDWSNLIKNPEGFLLSSESEFPNRISELIETKNEIIRNAIMKSKVYSEEVQHAGTKRFRLHSLRFNWILPFGRDNRFDFESRENICLINAPNGYGKTAFFEVIVLGLFGEVIPSRHNRSSSQSILNKRRAANTESCNIVLEFQLNDELYRIKRVFHEQIDKKQTKRLHCRVVELFRRDELIHSGSRVVSDWMKTNVCMMSDFLLFNMITQNVDMDFIKMSQREQIDMLDNAFHINYFNQVCEVLKLVRKEYKDLERHIVTHLKAIEPNGSFDPNAESKTDELKRRLLQNEHEWNECRAILADLIVDERKFFESACEEAPQEPLEGLSNRYARLRAKWEECFEAGFEPRLYPAQPAVDLFTDASEEVAPLSHDRDLLPEIRKIAEMRASLPPPPSEPPGEPGLGRSLEQLQEELLQMKQMLGFEEEEGELPSETPPEPDLSKEEIRDLSKTITREVEEMLETMTSEQAREEAFHTEHRVREILLNMPPPSSIEHPPETVEYTVEKISKIEEKLELARKEIQRIECNLGALESANSEIERLNERMRHIDIRLDNHPLGYNSNCSQCQDRLEAMQELKRERSGCIRKRNKLNKQHPKQLQESDIARIECLRSKATEYELVLERMHKRVEEHRRWESMQEIDLMKSRSSLLGRFDELKVLARHLQDSRRLHKRWRVYEENRQTLARMKQLERELELVEARQRRHEYDSAFRSLREHESVVRVTLHHREGCTLMATLERDIAEVRTKLSYYSQRKRDMMSRAEKHAVIDRDTRRELLLATSVQETWETYCTSKRVMEHTVALLERRNALLDQLPSTIKRYKAWVYNDKFLPVVVQKANEILGTIFDDRDFTLKFEFEDEVLSWFVQDEGNRIHVEKLSGAQAFAVGLSMRLGLGSMGISKYKCEQLFIDEGFCNFDQNNLARVPLLLARMCRLYKNIIMVTHVEEIKIAAHEVVNIERKDGLSKLLTNK